MADSTLTNYGVPEWNFIILPNYFDDDEYWSSNIQEECPEAYLAIANLGNKYENPREWINACQIYDQYIGTLIEYYGGEIAVQSYKEEFGSFPPGIKLRPKLDKTKSNKAFRETGILPPEKSKLFDPAIEMSSYVAQTIDGISDSEIHDMDIKVKKPKGVIRDMLLADRRNFDAEQRVKNNYVTESSISLDVIANYYARKDGETTSAHGNDDRSLEQIIAQYNESINQDQWESDIEGGYHQSGGIIYSAKSRARLEVAKALAANGIRPLNKKARKSMNPDEIRLIRKEIGESVLTKKEIKKARKEYKDYARKRERAVQSDRELGMALTQNKLALNNSMRLDDLIAKRRK